MQLHDSLSQIPPMPLILRSYFFKKYQSLPTDFLPLGSTFPTHQFLQSGTFAPRTANISKSGETRQGSLPSNPVD